MNEATLKINMLDATTDEIRDRHFPDPSAPERDALQTAFTLLQQAALRLISIEEAKAEIKELQAAHPEPFTLAVKEITHAVTDAFEEALACIVEHPEVIHV